MKDEDEDEGEVLEDDEPDDLTTALLGYYGFLFLVWGYGPN